MYSLYKVCKYDKIKYNKKHIKEICEYFIISYRLAKKLSWSEQ